MVSTAPLRNSAQRVDRALAGFGLEGRVRELPDSTRTAADAAGALGCEVRQIVKSLIFRTGATGDPVLVLVAGDHRLDEHWMERTTGTRWHRADPEYVRSVAGYAIGGVPPVGHPARLPTYVDYDLLEQRELWAAAGHPNAVCRLASAELLRITGGRPVSVVPLRASDAAPGPWASFDCYGTLVDWRRGFFQSLEKTLGSTSESELDRWFQYYLLTERCLEAGPYRSYRDLMVAALLEVADRSGRPISDRKVEEFPSSIPDWPAFPDSRKALERMRGAGYRLAILSNNDRDLLEETVARQRLPADLLVSAEEVRSYKPALAHWIRFLKVTGISPPEGTHVAAGYEYDIPPAALLGFRTAYVARYGPAPSPSVATTAFPDLAQLAERLATPPAAGPFSSASGRTS